MGDRRRSKRRTVRLPFTLSITSSTKALNGTRRVSTLNGHTLDLSAGGLALIVPSITLGEHHLVAENRRLDVKLDLPTGSVEMKATPVRYESLDEHETETGYLIAVQIAEMTEEDRAKFAAYFSSLPQQKR